MNLKYAFDKELYNIDEAGEKLLGPDWAKKIFESVLGDVIYKPVANPMGGPPSTSAANARSLGRIFNALDVSKNDIIDIELRDLTFLQKEFNSETAMVRQGKERVLVLITQAIEDAIKSN